MHLSASERGVTGKIGEPSDGDELPAVLIVDDVEANLVVLRALLEQVECRVTSATRLPLSARPRCGNRPPSAPEQPCHQGGT